MNAQEPAQKEMDTRSETRMSVVEKESYVRSAVDGSPHKIAIIRITDNGGGEHVIVAWRDENNNLVFDKKILGVAYSKSPDQEFGSPEISEETLKALANSKTIDATPLDFSVKHGANADVVAKAFMAVLKEERTGTEPAKTEDALQKAIEKVDPSQGVNLREVLQGGWEKLKTDYPGDAEGVARFVLKHVVGHEGSIAEGKAAEALDALLKTKDFDVMLPRTFVEKALGKVWDDLCEKFPVASQVFAKMVVEKYAPDVWGSPENVLTAAIPKVVGQAAPTQENWAKENSSRVYNSEQGKWVDAGKQPAEAKAEHVKDSEPEELMGRRGELNDRIDMLKTAVDGSPTGVAIVGVSRHSEGPNKTDHIMVVYKDHQSGEIRIAEMMPGEARSPGFVGALVNSKNNPTSVRDAVRTWDKFTAVPLNLTPEQDARFRASLAKNLSQENTYSFLTQWGNHCASAVKKALVDAGVWDRQEKGILAYFEKLGINVLVPGLLIEWAKDRGGVHYDSDRFRTTDLDPMEDPDEGGPDSEPVGPKPDVTVGLDERTWQIMGSVNAADRADLSTEIGASLTPATDADKGASLKQAALAWGTKDADPDDASQRAVTGGDDDDDEEALEDEVTLASDPDHTPAHDPARQPAIDDDEHELTLASDREGPHADPAQPPAIDDDEEHSLDDDEHEALADTSDGEHAPTADALMQTAKAETGADATADDQPAPQLATPVPLAADEGFSFAMFAKQVTPVDVVKEAMPAGQLSQEDIPGSGIPESESAHPDAGREDVGNAAPSTDRLVHHGDLAP
jgi:hypothetical protein